MIISFLQTLDKNIGQAVEQLSYKLFEGDLYTFALNVQVSIKPIALVILSVCFVFEFIKITMKADILKWETGLQIVAKFTLAYFAMDISFYLLSAIYQTAVEWVQSIAALNATSFSFSDQIDAALKTALEKYGILDSIGLLATLGISFFVVWATGLLIYVMAYARTFELMIYIAVSPLPCAFILLEDSGSRLFKKFIMNFAAVSIQGLFMIITIQLYVIIVKGEIDKLVPAAPAAPTAAPTTVSVPEIASIMLLGSIILLVLTFKSGSLAKSLMDVG